MKDLKHEAIQMTNYYIDKFNNCPQVKGTREIPYIQVSLNLKGNAAGMFCVDHFHNKVLIKYNKDLMTQNWSKFKETTIPHEVAHYIEHNYYGGWEFTRAGRRKVHGPRWKNIMRLLGVKEVTRCHSYDVSKTTTKKQQRFAYTCDCGEDHQVSKTIHNKILRGQRRLCNRCKSVIKRA